MIEVDNEITFCPNGRQSGEKDWVMKITKDGIIFNQERYPEAEPDDFALAVIKILENVFTVKFERKPLYIQGD